MARVLRIRPHLADPSGLHEGYTVYLYLTKVYEPFGTFAWSDLSSLCASIQTGNILPACELVLERLMKYGSRATYREG